MIPGEIFAAGRRDRAQRGRANVRSWSPTRGDRPIQVGSHYHFFETNAALRFDREAAYGFRLDIAAGTAVRFEPGQERTVELVALAGDRRVYGFNGEVMGALDEEQGRHDAHRPPRLCRDVRARRPATACGSPTPSCSSRSRRTSPIYGEEVKFGGGKVIRDGMGQSQRAARRGRRHRDHQRADHRSLGHRQSRHRHQGRPHRRHRQGRQSRHPARRRHRDRPRHRSRSPAKA